MVRDRLRAAVAERWRDAILGTSFVPMSSHDLDALLRGFIDDLDDVLLDEHLPLTSAGPVGARLITDVHLTNPASLSRTLSVLLSATAEMTDGRDDRGRRWHGIIATLAEGYTTALRDLVLDQQQEMLDAAITARDHADNARWQAERTLEQTKEQYLATISHELRTPLTPIKGFLHMLLTQGEHIEADRRAELYRVMLSETDLLRRLLDDLLAAASWPSESQFGVTMANTDVAHVIHLAIAGVDPTSSRPYLWLGDDEVGPASCDPLRLRQVLAILLRNADQYSTPGNPVHVSASRHADTVHIQVRDFGPGIPTEMAEAVFEAFHRLNRGTIPGTGLGLHIARRLTQAMGGRIWVTDAAPGALFHVTLQAG